MEARAELARRVLVLSEEQPGQAEIPAHDQQLPRIAGRHLGDRLREQSRCRLVLLSEDVRPGHRPARVARHARVAGGLEQGHGVTVGASGALELVAFVAHGKCITQEEPRIRMYPCLAERARTLDQLLDLPDRDVALDPERRVRKLELGQQLSARVPALSVQLERFAE